MKIVLIGATGFIGSVILKEALERGHLVTAISRSLPQHPHLAAQSGDISNPAQVPGLVAGHEAVISAISPGRDTVDKTQRHTNNYRSLIAGMKAAGVTRLLVVGGAGSLEVAPGVQLVDTPEFPPQWKSGSLAGRAVLDLLRDEKDLEWTYLSPSNVIAPGERTGKFRLGTNQLLTDADGNSHISVQDYAVAMVDELEHPRHIRQRFTVGY